MKWTIPQTISLLDALKERYPESSTNTLRSWIQQGRLTVDSIVARLPSLPIQAGQSLQIASPRGQIPEREGRYASIVYEDRYLTVVDKKSGALSVATPHESLRTVHAQLKERYYPNPVYVVHRLDQGTSGLMIFGRDLEAFSHLKEQLAAHKIERRYLALVTGIPDPLSGTWRSFLYEDKLFHVHTSDNPHCGEEAVTYYRTLGHRGNCAVLEFILATGKKNQIRVHCERAGVPIVGDDKYGGEKLLPRLMLHAYLLSFVHPITQEIMSFTSPIPRYFTQRVPAAKWLKAPMTLEARRHVSK